MRSGRIVAAGLLALMASSAFATPVTMTTPYVHWWWDDFSKTGNDLNIGQGDCRSPFSCLGLTSGTRDRVTNVGTEDAPILTHHFGTVGYGMTYDEGNTDFNIHSFLDVYASVDESYPRGMALTAVKIDRFVTTFEVFEPVLYTGTFDIYEGGGNPLLRTESDDRTWIHSGTVLQPGFYSTTLTFDWVTTGTLSAGQEVYASRTTNWSYHFSQVPVPATLPLIGFGLLIAGLARGRKLQG